MWIEFHMLSCRGTVLGKSRAKSWSLWLSPVAFCSKARYCWPPLLTIVVLKSSSKLDICKFSYLLISIRMNQCFGVYTLCTDVSKLVSYWPSSLGFHVLGLVLFSNANWRSFELQMDSTHWKMSLVPAHVFFRDSNNYFFF